MGCVLQTGLPARTHSNLTLTANWSTSKSTATRRLRSCNDVMRECNDVMTGCYGIMTGYYDVMTGCYDIMTECYDVMTGCYDIMTDCYDVMTGCYGIMTGYYDGMTGCYDAWRLTVVKLAVLRAAASFRIYNFIMVDPGLLKFLRIFR